MKKTLTLKKLVVKKETLRALNVKELAPVNGGGITNFACSLGNTEGYQCHSLSCELDN